MFTHTFSPEIILRQYLVDSSMFVMKSLYILLYSNNKILVVVKLLMFDLAPQL